MFLTDWSLDQVCHHLGCLLSMSILAVLSSTRGSAGPVDLVTCWFFCMCLRLTHHRHSFIYPAPGTMSFLWNCGSSSTPGSYTLLLTWCLCQGSPVTQQDSPLSSWIHSSESSFSSWFFPEFPRCFVSDFLPVLSFLTWNNCWTSVNWSSLASAGALGVVWDFTWLLQGIPSPRPGT